VDPERDEEALQAEADREAAGLIPREEWERLLRLDAFPGKAIFLIILWALATAYAALRYADDLLRAYHSGNSTLAAKVLWGVALWAAIPVICHAASLISRRRREARLRTHEQRGYDPKRICRAMLSREVRDHARAEREEEEAQRDEEQRWRDDRAAELPWWRTEISNGHLLLNLYVLAGGLAFLDGAQADHPLKALVWVLAGAALFVKFAVHLAALAMIIWRPWRLIIWWRWSQLREEMRIVFRMAWRYYKWWGRSKFALALAVLLGVSVVAFFAVMMSWGGF